MPLREKVSWLDCSAMKTDTTAMCFKSQAVIPALKACCAVQRCMQVEVADALELKKLQH